jgi:hypothetical protein
MGVKTIDNNALVAKTFYISISEYLLLSKQKDPVALTRSCCLNTTGNLALWGNAPVTLTSLSSDYVTSLSSDMGALLVREKGERLAQHDGAVRALR